MTPIPGFPDAVAERTGLLRRLDESTRLAVVCAVPGTGKTTLAVTWAHRRVRHGDNVAWFSAVDMPDGGSLRQAITDLVAANTAERLIVILDDAHHLDEAAVAGLCDVLASEPALHVLVCTRERHVIEDQARLRELEMTALTGRDLNATEDELGDIAAAWGHGLAPDRVRELRQQTGGWLAPARAALDGADPDLDPTGLLAAGNHLREVILPRMADDAALMLAMTLSLFGKRGFSLPLATAVLVDDPHTPDLVSPRSPEEALAHLERDGLLERAPGPDGGDEWHLPLLVAAVLAEVFATQHPERARHTHQVIADALPADETQGQGGRIIYHARAAQNWDLLDRMWAAHGLRLVLFHPEETSFAYGDIPDSTLTEYPALAVAATVVASMRGQGNREQRARLVRSYADAGWALHASRQPQSRHAAHDTMTVTSQIIADRVAGKPFAAVERAERHAQSLLGTAAASPVSATTRAWFELQWALSCFAATDWLRSTHLFSRAADRARTADAGFIVSAASAQMAMMNAVSGWTNDARDDLATHRSIDTAGQWLHHTIAAPAHIADALLRLDQLDPTATDALAQAGDGTGSAEEWAILTWVRAQNALLFGDPVATLADVNHVAVLHAAYTHPDGRDRLSIDRTFTELLLAMGELNRADRRLRDAGLHHLTFAVPRARLALISARYAEAVTIAGASAWEPLLMLRDRTDLFMIKAVALLATGDSTGAAESFTRAHRLATRMGSLIPYANVPREALLTLLELSNVTLPDTALARLASCRQVYPDRGELITLTPREMAILSAMVEHETLADIAAEFTVSLNTVKKQSVAIYSKLGVNDRAAALLRAHRLGLLPVPHFRSAGDDHDAHGRQL